jgi:hypothetical protein
MSIPALAVPAAACGPPCSPPPPVHASALALPLQALFGVLRQWLAENLEPDEPEELLVTLRSGRQIRLPVPAADNRPPRPENDCEKDILALLAEVGHRMTTDEILAELPEHNYHHGDTTVRLALARMAKPGVGLLTKNGKAHPRGYGLPDWEN